MRQEKLKDRALWQKIVRRERQGSEGKEDGGFGTPAESRVPSHTFGPWSLGHVTHCLKDLTKAATPPPERKQKQVTGNDLALATKANST